MAFAQTPEYKALRVDAATGIAQTVTVDAFSYQTTVLAFDPPGATKSYDYEITTRICISTTNCSAWEVTPIHSGTMSGTASLTLTLNGPAYQYRLVISNLVNTPTIKVMGLLSK